MRSAYQVPPAMPRAFVVHQTPVLMVNRHTRLVVLVSFMATGSIHGACVYVDPAITRAVDAPQVGDYREDWAWQEFDRVDSSHVISLANDPVPGLAKAPSNLAAAPGVYTPPVEA